MHENETVQSPVLGDKIRAIRATRDENREVVAARAGISMSTLQRAEASDDGITFRTVLKIAKALDVSATEIYAGVEEPQLPSAHTEAPAWFTQFAEQLDARLTAIESTQREMTRLLEKPR